MCPARYRSTVFYILVTRSLKKAVYPIYSSSQLLAHCITNSTRTLHNHDNKVPTSAMSTEHLLVFENDTHVLNSSVLPSKIQDCDQFESRKTPSRRCRTCTSHCLCLTQALIALLNIILFVALLFAWKSSKDCLSESNHCMVQAWRRVLEFCINNYLAPAQHMLEYQPKYFDKYAHLGNNPFSQKPGAELDAAWHKLLTGRQPRGCCAFQYFTDAWTQGWTYGYLRIGFSLMEPNRFALLMVPEFSPNSESTMNYIVLYDLPISLSKCHYSYILCGRRS